MTFCGRLKTIGREVLYRVASVTGDFFSGVGTLAATMSGLTFATSFMVDNDVSVSYAASGQLNSYAKIDLSLQSGVNTTKSDIYIPFNKTVTENGQYKFNVNEYVSPELLRLFAVIACSTGLLCRLIGLQINQWLRLQKDKRELSELALDSYRLRERAYFLLANVMQSISLTIGIASLTFLIYQLSKLKDYHYLYTVPSESQHRINNSNYSYPVELYKLNYNFAHPYSQNINLPKHTFGNTSLIQLLLNSYINADVTTYYGAGIEVQNNSQSTAWIYLPLLLSLFMFQAGNVLDDYSQEYRIKRILDAERNKDFDDLSGYPKL